MQNKTVMKMAIALLRGEPFVEERRKKKTWGNVQVKLLPVSSRACGGSITLIDDTMYANGAWTMQARVHQKRDKLLAVITPDFAYSQFTADAKSACDEMKVPFVGVRPDLPHAQACEYFEFATWRLVRDAAMTLDSELTQNCLLVQAENVARDRSVYARFFGLKWRPILRSAPDDLDELTSVITRKRVEGPKKELPDWRKQQAAEVGIITPFWLRKGVQL